MVAHIEDARSMAHRFESRAKFGRDYSEAESVAMLALVKAATSYEPERGVPFWAFAKLRVKGALIDAVRARFGRSETRRIHVELDATREWLKPDERAFLAKSNEAALLDDPWEAVDARIVLMEVQPLMSPTERKFIDGVLLLGVCTEADSALVGMTVHNYRQYRRKVILKIREAHK